MNRKTLSLAVAAAALVSGQAFAADVANWSPDAGARDAFPALRQVQGPGKTVAEVRAGVQRQVAVQAGSWAPDASTADAFPSLQAAGPGARSRDEVRAEAQQANRERIATARPLLKFGA